jgi:hypothetical protein
MNGTLHAVGDEGSANSWVNGATAAACATDGFETNPAVSIEREAACDGPTNKLKTISNSKTTGTVTIIFGGGLWINIFLSPLAEEYLGD